MRQSKRLLAIAIAFALAALSSTSEAETVAVLAPRAPLRAKITRALKQQRVRVVPGSQVGKALRNEQVPLSDADWARVAGKLGIDAFVIANPASGGGAAPQLDVVIRSASDGAISNQEIVSARARPKQMGALLASALSKRSAPVDAPSPPSSAERASESLAAAGPSAPETTRPARSPTAAGTANAAVAPQTGGEASGAAADNDGPAAAGKASTAPGATTLVGQGHIGKDRFGGAAGKLSTFDVEADARELRRTFDYTGGAGGPRYRLTFNPVAGARASYFPVRNAGLFVAGEFGAGLETSGFPTGTRELMGGVQGRLPLSFGQLGASAGYFHHAFLVQDTTSTTDPSRLTLGVPNTVYAGARLGVSARVALASRVQLTLDAAYRLVTTVGDGAAQVRSPSYFPGSSTPYGLDGRAVVGVVLSRTFEARAGFDYRRYGYGKLQGTTAGGAPIDATGAADQYMAFSLGLAAVLGPQ